jgi:predicted phosphodiesterase
LSSSYDGVLLIGDPHAASKVVGFRKDNYPRTVLRKLEWCLRYAEESRLLPVCLGDLFHVPRDNANWLLAELIALLAGRGVCGVYGNHDVRESALGEDDSLNVLVTAGAYRLLTPEDPWRGIVGGWRAAVFGISWNQPLRGIQRWPEDELVLLVTHHDMGFIGYEQARISCAELEGVDLAVNGHIHRRLEPQIVGGTRWLNPGNIVRVSRSDVSRTFVPSVLVLVPDGEELREEWVAVPHEAYEDVFHEGVEEDVPGAESMFVRGLADLQARRTKTGEGLREFLDRNLDPFEDDVRAEIESLVSEVLGPG